MPTVSVVIPAYNAARYLAAAVDSALQQTFRDVEVLVVDDGSTDDTPAVLSAYRSRIHVVRQANAGVARARNAGTEAARGRYVAFLDADDLWQPEKIEKQMAALAAALDRRACYSAFTLVAADLTVLGVSRTARQASLVEDLLLRGNVVGTPSTVVCERDLVREVGGFDPAQSLGADWDLWLRLALRTEFAYVAEPLIRYRIHDANMSRDVVLLERDSVRLLEKALADPALPAHLRTARRRVLGHNDRVLAGSYFQAGRLVDGVRCAVRALARHPGEIRYFLDYPRRLLGRRA
jgi:glycosyltransferase involved in cell wall biosynthesis